MHTNPPTRAPLLLLAAALAAAVSGCGSAPTEASAPPEFPFTEPPIAAESLDIQVTRDETHVVLTNTVARRFGPSRLWVNRWYSRRIDGFDIGQTLDLNLSTFKDPDGAEFRAGGFFATQKPDSLVSFHVQPDAPDGTPGSDWFSLTVVARPE